MSISNPDRFILPDEKTARRYGLLNVMFGSILIFANLWMAYFYIAAALLENTLDFAVEAGTIAVANERRDSIQAWKDREAAATNETTRALARDKVAELEAEPRISVSVSTMGFKALQDRRVKLYNIFEISTGLLLNTLMIVGGAGLLGLREWGRKLAIMVASIKLARLALLISVSLFVIVPLQVAEMAKDMPAVMGQMKGQPNNPANVFLTPQWISAQSTGGVVLNTIFASIYPILLLVKLTKARVRAACHSGPKPASKENSW